jgi:hypothetical protein
MHTYFTDTQQGGVVPNALHFWDTAISNASDQATDINTIKAAEGFCMCFKFSTW